MIDWKKTIMQIPNLKDKAIVPSFLSEQEVDVSLDF
jgi:hypothetical protein